MPKLFNVGSYHIYFWSNESIPLEPIHVHISLNIPQANTTKVWITSSRKALLCNNNSNINKVVLNNILEIIESQSDEIIKKWVDYFGEVTYYC